MKSSNCIRYLEKKKIWENNLFINIWMVIIKIKSDSAYCNFATLINAFYSGL